MRLTRFITDLTAEVDEEEDRKADEDTEDEREEMRNLELANKRAPEYRNPYSFTYSLDTFQSKHS